jgi:hypothetical protein
LNQLLAKTGSARAVRVAAITFIIVSAVALYARDVPNNPPGFYIDDSSIAYNAHTISQTGRDEYGVHWPLTADAMRRMCTRAGGTQMEN